MTTSEQELTAAAESAAATETDSTSKTPKARKRGTSRSRSAKTSTEKTATDNSTRRSTPRRRSPSRTGTSAEAEVQAENTTENTAGTAPASGTNVTPKPASRRRRSGTGTTRSRRTRRSPVQEAPEETAQETAPKHTSRPAPTQRLLSLLSEDKLTAEGSAVQKDPIPRPADQAQEQEPAVPGLDFTLEPEEPQREPDSSKDWSTEHDNFSSPDAFEDEQPTGADTRTDETEDPSQPTKRDWRNWSGWNDEPARTPDEDWRRDDVEQLDIHHGDVAERIPEAESAELNTDAVSANAEITEEPSETEPEIDDGASDNQDDEEDRGKRRRRGRRGGRSHGGRRTGAQDDEKPVTMMPGGGTPVPVTTVDESRGASEEPRESESAEPKRPAGKRRMYISVLPGEQVEVAITNNGILDEYYLDMLHQKKIKGNIYRGIIHNIDTNLQAAFVEFGSEKNGFLQIDEIHPEYYTSHHEPTRGKKFPPIQKVLHIGQEVLVQVVKEPNGSKGAFLTTWISLAGRFLVLTPGQEQIGISRKVNDEEERSRLRELMQGIDPGDDLGVIVRTVSAGVTRTTLKNDLSYLKRTWNEVRKRATEVSAPACVYKEPGLPERAIRDYLTDDVCEVWVDSNEVANRIRETVALLFPNKKDLVRLHADIRHSMWERFNLRRQLDQIYSREVLMPSGGRLVFDQTEALMAIDINSGKISGRGNFEAMAFRTNMEAAETIARQLKLRDIGGQVVIDFIEMREHKHINEVERTLRLAMKLDRARHDVAHMSSFGLLELVRQRTGTSAISISMEPCPACGGTGLRRNLEWQSLQALRDLNRLLRSRTSSTCQYEMPQELGLYLLNHKRDTLKELENQFGKSIEIVLKV